MSDLKNKFENSKDKVVGKAKEGLGQITGSQVTELKGKIQYKKADIKENANNTKEKMAENINNKLDEKEEDKKISSSFLR